MPRRSLLDVTLGYIKWLALLVASAVLVWIPQTLLLLLGATIGAKSFFRRTDRSQLSLPDPQSLQHNTLNISGIRLHCVTAGSKDKPLMLFIHGFPELWYSWRHQLAEFQGDYHVAAFDMRGYGDSDKPQDQAAYTIENLVADAAGVIDALGHSSATLVVHDWGGLVGWALTAMQPELVDRLVVIGLPHPLAWNDNLDFGQLRKSWYMGAFYAPFLAETMLPADDLKVFDTLFKTVDESPSGMRRQALEPEEIDRYKQKFAGKGAWTGPLGCYRNYLDNMTRGGAGSTYFRRLQAALRRGVSKPTLMLYADSDTALGQNLLKGTDRYVSDLELHVLEDCSHFVQQDRPEEVNRLMRAWLARQAA